MLFRSRVNWGDDHLLIGDIFKVQENQLPDQADLAWGSFPCQDLSLGGNGLGLDGERSGAFWGFWKLIRDLNRAGRKPRMIVLENVFGTLTSHDGKDFNQIARAVGITGVRSCNQANASLQDLTPVTFWARL